MTLTRKTENPHSIAPKISMVLLGTQMVRTMEALREIKDIKIKMDLKIKLMIKTRAVEVLTTNTALRTSMERMAKRVLRTTKDLRVI